MYVHTLCSLSHPAQSPFSLAGSHYSSHSGRVLCDCLSRSVLYRRAHHQAVELNFGTAWENNPAAKAAAAAQVEVSRASYIVCYVPELKINSQRISLWYVVDPFHPAKKQTNLPPNVNEDNMGTFFAKYGPVGTVKIMWRELSRPSCTLITSHLTPPARGEDELLAVRKGRGALTGFVNFMTREDAAKALNELDGLEWGGNQIRVAWGKPMPLPQNPAYGKLFPKPFS